MLHPVKALLPAVAALCLSAAAFADGPMWYADYDEAAKEAAKTGKDMLVDFTGSDWCVWCKKLDKEVYQLEAFQKGVEKDFVLVALDFPRAEDVKAKVPNPKRNAELLKQNGINGYPTVLLMNSKGEVYGRTGYQPGGPEAYVAHLNELRTSGKQALEKIGAVTGTFEKASGDAKLKAWDGVADFAETLDSESPFGARLAEPLKTAFTVDPKNEQGRKLRAVKALFKLGQADDGVLATATELDPTNAKGLLEMALQSRFDTVHDETSARGAIEALTKFEAAAKFSDGKTATRFYSNAAFWLAKNLNDAEAAKPWAKKALDLKPEDAEQVKALEEIAAGT